MKPYSVFLIVILLIPFNPALAQRDNNWYFGKYAGIGFNGGVPTALTGSPINTYEGTSCISDLKGKLLFYTNGSVVFNRDHKVMQGAGWLTGNWSSTQTAIIIPQPGSDNLYYVFTSNGSTNGPGGNPDRGVVDYCKVDMDRDSGRGELIAGPVNLLTDFTTEKLTAVLHENSEDFWIITPVQKPGSCKFFSYLVSKNGVAPPVISTMNSCVDMQVGYLRPSPDGKKIAAANFPAWKCELFDFNPGTGIVSNPVTVCNRPAYGVEFSPDGSKLYVTSWDLNAYIKNVFSQYDLSPKNIPATEVIIANDTYFHASLKLGPDNKIYVGILGDSTLCVIENPNGSGLSCKYTPRSILLAPGAYCQLGLPNSVNTFRYKPFASTIRLCEGDSMRLESKAKSGQKVLWSSGDTSRTIFVKAAGWHWLKTFNSLMDTIYDSVYVTLSKKFKVYLGADTAFCGAFSHLLDAGEGALKYSWNTGDTTVTILVNKTGLYAVTIKDSNACPYGDTIIIKPVLPPAISIHRDMDCHFVYLSVVREPGVKYNWSTGDTGVMITTDKKGKYTVTATGLFCSNSQTIEVDKLPLTAFDLGPDIYTCEENTVILKCEQGSNFTWSTGEVSPSIKVTESGVYRVTVSENNCSVSDSIKISFFGDCGLTFYIPNAFTPNGDNLNSIFKVTGDNISEIQMQVYNRWGQLIFSGIGDHAYWDGTYHGQPCEQDVYVYIISLSGTQKRKLIRKELSGHFTLLR